MTSLRASPKRLARQPRTRRPRRRCAPTATHSWRSRVAARYGGASLAEQASASAPTDLGHDAAFAMRPSRRGDAHSTAAASPPCVDSQRELFARGAVSKCSEQPRQAAPFGHDREIDDHHCLER